AVEAGAALCHARVEALEPGADEVRVEIGSRAGPALRARFVLVATGADISLLRPHGMIERQEPSAVAVRCYIRSDFEIDRLVVSLDRSLLPGYAWIFPVGEGEYNVGCGVISQSLRTNKVDLRAMLDGFLREFPLARELQARAIHTGPVRGAQLRCGLTGTRVWDGGRILAAGESLGATFPFSGEGIGKAMETAEIAADFLDAALTAGGPERLAGYAARLRAELRPRYLGYEVAERWLSRRWVGDLVMRRARKSPAVRAAFEGVFTETVDPRQVFSLPGLLRLLVA
ncbi:MAG TPA: NAD(P)/FAD-dependent oxidoreductase, partial [Longimicrobiaceae bacterium]|nr:NAD(P)/FAD-dependent oxidoreductase [Longimicrobiaceae bacterium]